MANSTRQRKSLNRWILSGIASKNFKKRVKLNNQGKSPQKNKPTIPRSFVVSFHPFGNCPQLTPHQSLLLRILQHYQKLRMSLRPDVWKYWKKQAGCDKI